MQIKSEGDQSISAVIPTLGNRLHYLTEALKSIESQTLYPDEVLIINNGQISSKELLNQLSLNIPLRIVDTIYRAGASQARNLGASLAQGKYVAFLDDDDIWDSNYLKEMHKEITRKDVKCVISKIYKLEDGEISKLFDATNYLTQRYFLLMNPGVTGSNIVIDKSYFLSLGGYDCMLPTGEDGDLILKILDSGEKIVICGETKAIMRMHQGERLTSNESLARGYRALYFKYRSRVSNRDAIYLIWRYRREEYKTHKRPSKFLKMLFWTVVIIIFRRTPKSIYVMEK